MSVVSEFLAHAEHRPDHPALWSPDRVVGYGRLAELARRAADRVKKLPGVPAIPVAAPLAKTPEAIAVVLGCLLVGRPILLPSVDLGRQSLDALLARAGCGFVASQTSGGIAWHQLPAAEAPDEVPADTAMLLTTSGSTGIPKVVPIGNAAMTRFTEWAAESFDLDEISRVLNYAPLNFDLCLLDIWSTLRAGGTVIMVDGEKAVNPRYLSRLLAQAEPHVVQSVPMTFRILAEGFGSGDGGFGTVRHVMLTGDHAPASLRAVLPELFPKATFHNIYGCTETNDSFRFSCGAEEVAVADTLPLGEPLPGVTTLLEDAGHRVEGPGTGELLVSTPFQTPGYLGDDHRNAERFVDRERAGRSLRFFRSGDLVTRNEDGSLHLVGRNDFQVKVRGIRISLEEVERVITAHPQVVEAAVVALPDPAAGNRLYALVRRSQPQELTSLGLRSHCAARLLKAAIPTEIRLVDEPLPHTSTGKVNRARITSDLQKGSI